jgi:hypothetical protein
MRVTVLFDADGNVLHIQSPDLAFLETLGPREDRRASHIVPENSVLRWLFRLLRRLCRDGGAVATFTRRWPCSWQVNLRPSGGPVLGPFPLRTDALAAEVAWLEAHVLMTHDLAPLPGLATSAMRTAACPEAQQISN